MTVNSIFSIASESAFQQTALQVFKHQFETNKVYRSFCDLLYKHPSSVTKIEDIPFLPIQFFKSKKVISGGFSEEITFTSSGTTSNTTSSHFVKDIELYKQSFRQGFAHFYGSIEDYVVLALLPNYLERKGSSLTFMVDDMIRQSKHSESGFYLYNLDELAQKLRFLDENGQKVLLIGVSFALLDLVEKHQFQLKNTVVMETGGMKGRRKELIRDELHLQLRNGFGVNAIHSEYGMTELLSQAYSLGNGRFSCPPWMRILLRDTEDPLTLQNTKKTGAINVIDLANYHSCSFIATDDLGKLHQDQFEVLGRFDTADVRGCNLMVL